MNINHLLLELFSQIKRFLSFPFQRESSKKVLKFQASSFQATANLKSKIQNPKSPDKQYQSFLLIIILVLGLGFRTIHVGEKIYWVDEVSTSLRVSGYTRQEIIQEVSQRSSITVQELRTYQQLNPDRDWNDTFYALSQSPEHAPLYFILLRGWQQLFGSSVIATRSLSIIFNLLCLPVLYFVCLELFKTKEVGQIAISLFAISPFFVVYSQEARPYSLWTFMLLLSSLTLLRAIRSNNSKTWFSYSLTLTLSLYTSILSAFTLISSSLYLFCLEPFKLTKRFKNYIIYSGLSVILFSPWLRIMSLNWQQLQDNTTWAKAPMIFFSKLAIFIYNISILFFDFLVSEKPNFIVILSGAFCTIFVLGLVGFAIYFLYKTTPISSWLFIFSLIFINPFLLFLIDWISQGQGSATSRYLIPCYLGILLAVAYLLGHQISYAGKLKKRQFWAFIFVFLLSIGIISCLLYQDTVPMYQKGRNRHNLAIAHLINQSSSSALIAETQQFFDVLSLSYQLNPNLTIYLFPQSHLENTLLPCQSLLLFNPSPQLKNRIQQEQKFNLEEVYKPDRFTSNDIYLSLWKIQRSGSSCR